jgi:vacuolar-type H+-ATPase subunit E/Vma4
MQNLGNSLSAYYALRQQKTAEISTRIGQIQQQLAAELQALQGLEQQLLSAQENVLEQIRPVLATDVRSLLSTSQFQEFVRDLLQEVKAKLKQASFVLEVAPKTTKWLLHTLERVMNFWDWLEWEYGKKSIPNRCQ